MLIPQQSCWMIRNVFCARDKLASIDTGRVIKGSRIRYIDLQLLGRWPKVEWRGMMFQDQARPKAVSTMWLLHERMLTVDRLSKWGIQVDTTYRLCKQAPETIAHLFAACVFSKTSMGQDQPMITSTSSHRYRILQHWIITNTKGKSYRAKILKMIYAEFVHMVWMEKNTSL